eukprot:9125173-Pyramimonas_sp.AAC.1
MRRDMTVDLRSWTGVADKTHRALDHRPVQISVHIQLTQRPLSRQSAETESGSSALLLTTRFSATGVVQ